MAPEQAQAKKVDARTDLYALGIIAFEMLTGRVPFQAESPLAVAMSQVVDAPPKPRTLEPSIPTALEGLVLRLLAKNPDERPSSAEVVRTELKRIKNDLASEATTIGHVPEVRRPTPAREEAALVTRDTEPTPAQLPAARKPPALALAFGGATVAALVAALLLWREGPAGSPPAPPLPKPDPVVVAPPPVKPVAAPPIAVQPPPAVEDDVDPPPAGTQPNRPRPAPRKAMGALKVVPKGCWMDVFVDGKLIGRAPHEPFPVSTGSHLLRLANPACATPVLEKQIVIKPGETLAFEHNFRP
jgi:serine/threonine-protein kinase